MKRLVTGVSGSFLLGAAAGCVSPYVQYARLLNDDVSFGDVVSGTSATAEAEIENLTDEEAYAYFLPPVSFTASLEDESGEEYVPIDVEEQIPIPPLGTASIALTYTCEDGAEGAFDAAVAVVAGHSPIGPWTATQEVGALRFRGTCVTP